MPTYEYVCEKCGHNFDAFQSMLDPRLEDCPLESCDGKVRRKIGRGAGLIFKGSGFYSTDYRSADYHSAAKKDNGKDTGKSAPAESQSKSGDSSGSSKSGEAKTGETKTGTTGGTAPSSSAS